MGRYPVGPKLKSTPTFVRNVPAPPSLWWFYLLNGVALFVFCVLLIGLQFDNNRFVTAGSFEQALLVVHFFFIAIAVIWSIWTNRRVSRILCILNSGGLALASVLVSFNDPEPLLAGIAAVVSAGLAALVLYGSSSAKQYYAVLSGELAPEDFQPFSKRAWRIADSFGTIVGYIGEAFILFLAVFMVLRFVFHD